MVLKYLLIVIATICFLLFAIGIYRLRVDIEPNLCQMTYMFKNPQYTMVKARKNIGGYGLYYYNEGNEKADLNSLNGAPVLFVPGNGGSYKQVRSLGSVALRLGMGYNKPHLDYFTIDYNEELTALYGGYLNRQQHYLEQCINTILRLYKATDKTIKRKIVVIGHSMGGVIAKSVLTDTDWLKKIAVVIFISTPLDQPVIYADKEIDNFYKAANLLEPSENKPTNEVMIADDVKLSRSLEKNGTNLAEVLLISIGGGNRDNLVPTALTESRLSDVHVITTAIPNVWVSCDHLAAMWCLQLMKVVNKFLYAITFKAAGGLTYFGTNSLLNLHEAQDFFIGGAHTAQLAIDEDFSEFSAQNWTSSKALRFYKIFENGISMDYQHAVLYDDVAPFEHIYIAVTHETALWLFGCNNHNCVENPMLTQQIMQLPTNRGQKTYALLNLAAIFGTFSSWTHLLIRLAPTRHYASLYIDVHNAEERTFGLSAPQVYEFKPKALNIQVGAPAAVKPMFRTLQIKDLTEIFYAFKLKFDFAVDELAYENNFETTIKIYASWAVGFERYYTLIRSTQTVNHDVLIHLPKQLINLEKNNVKPLLYVDIHTDPWCNISLSYQFTLTDTMRFMAQQYYHWLPAHMAVIIISCLGSQFRQHAIHEKSYFDFLQLKSWYFVVAVRLASNAMALLPFLPQEMIQSLANRHYSSYATIIMHGFAMACCLLITLVVRTNLIVLRKIARKLNLATITIPKLHVIFAITAACISMACSKCISLAIVLMVYTLLLAFANKTTKTPGNVENEAVLERAAGQRQELLEKRNESSIESTTKPTTSTANVNLLQNLSKIQKIQTKTGFQNSEFHVVLLILIFLLLLINLGDTIAWFKNFIDHNSYYSLQSFQTLLFNPVICVIFCLPLLWHLKAPTNLQSTPIYALILNITAAMSLLLCEEKLYRLNYVIAFVVALLVLRELLSKKEKQN